MDTLSSSLNLGELSETLEDLSRDVDSAYDHVMKRIRQQEDRRRDLAIRILCWVAYGGQLTINELRHALAVVPGRAVSDQYLCTEEMLMEVCAGLIHVVKDSDMVVPAGKRTFGKS
jgi:hypothetical protein